MSEEEKEKAISKLLYQDKREEFKKFVESLKQRNGHASMSGPSTSKAPPVPSASDALRTARQFIPFLQKDTEELVTKMAEGGEEAAKELRKDVVSIEEDQLMDSSVTVPKIAKAKKSSKKRRHARPLFKSEAKRSEKDDGLVPVNVFMCQMKGKSEDAIAGPPLITMIPEPIEESVDANEHPEELPSQMSDR